MSASRRSTPDHLQTDNWYHGSISRQESETKLQESGFSEGLFLVRDSGSCPEDFVLCVVTNNNVIHYQIRKMGPDALFKLGHDKKILHGLDTFIDYYRSGKKTGLQHILSDFVPGKAAPAESKLHGSENLLHRASTEGNIVVVTELLASGYRNIDAKNQDSQTAVHLASYSGHIEVLSQLFKYGAKVNIADTEGYTPLHYAAMANKPQSVKMLLESGGANPTMRNELTGWVPLHQAASAGHIDCVTALLESQAPTRPRTGNNETPADLARAGGHPEISTLLDKYPPVYHDTHITQFYHHHIDRKQALSILKEAGNRTGSFLVRNSSKKIKFFVLSMIYNNKGHHFEIEKQGSYFFIDMGPYMSSLENLVYHYSLFSDGLPCKLVHAVKPREVSLSLDCPSLPWDCLSLSHSRTPSLAVPTLQPSLASAPCLSPVPAAMPSVGLPAVPPRVPTRGPSSQTVMPSNLKRIDTRENYENNEAVRRLRHSKDNVPLESIKLDQVIGEVGRLFMSCLNILELFLLFIAGRVWLGLQGELHEQFRHCKRCCHQSPEQ